MAQREDAGVWFVLGGLVALAITRPDLLVTLVTWGAWSLLLVPLVFLAIAVLWHLVRALWGFILAAIFAVIGARFLGEWGAALGIACAGWIVWAEAWWHETHGTASGKSPEIIE